MFIHIYTLIILIF